MVDDRLGPDHVCRRDDPSYPTVGAWYEAHRGRVPIQAAHALSKLTRDGRMSFAEAFRTLADRGALILIDDEPSEEPVERKELSPMSESGERDISQRWASHQHRSVRRGFDALVRPLLRARTGVACARRVQCRPRDHPGPAIVSFVPLGFALDDGH